MKIQFAWHVHHDRLIEPLIGSIEERVAYIKEHKPEHERDIRLRLLKPVIGSLPIIYAKAEKALIEAWKASDEAWKTYDEAKEASIEARKASVEAWKVYVEAWEAIGEAKEAYDEARKASVEAWKVYVKAGKVSDKARKAYNEAWKVSQPIIEQLHLNECQNCPWDGKTIFPPATKGIGGS